MPVPAKLIVCGLLPALSEMLSWPLKGPSADGVKVRLMVQLEPAFTELPQVLL